MVTCANNKQRWLQGYEGTLIQQLLEVVIARTAHIETKAVQWDVGYLRVTSVSCKVLSKEIYEYRYV